MQKGLNDLFGDLRKACAVTEAVVSADKREVKKSRMDGRFWKGLKSAHLLASWMTENDIVQDTGKEGARISS